MRNRLKRLKRLNRLNRLKRVISLLLVLSLGIGLFPGLSLVTRAQPPTARVYIDPGAGTAPVGGTYTIEIRIENVTDLYGFEFDLTFDPNVLKVKSGGVTEGEFLKRGGASTFFQGGTIDNTNGRIDNVAATRLAPTTTGESGSGSLATIVFDVIGTGNFQFVLSGVNLSDPNANPIDKNISLGIFDNQPPATVTDFSASDGDNTLSFLHWTNPSDVDLAEVVVQRKEGSYPTNHTDGTQVYQNLVPTPGAGVSITDFGLTNGLTYYYAVFSKDTRGNWNDTLDSTPPDVNADTGMPQAPPAPPHLLISEVFYDTPGADADEEWIEIYNPTGSAVDISNYKLGDEETQGGTEGMFEFPDGTTIQDGAKMTVALKATGFNDLYGKNPDFEVVETSPTVPNMIKYSSWGTGNTIALANGGDEVLLLDGSDNPVDVVTYGDGSYPGVTPHPGVVTSGHSLERFPADQDTDDCSVDFRDQAVPNPETSVVPPENQPPVANANGPYLGNEGEPILFDGSGSSDPNSDPITYLWDFGDGTSSTQQNPTHIYAQEGNYNVTLVVNDGELSSDPSNTTANIADKDPTANFTANPLSGTAPLSVAFTDTSTSYDGITSWEWDFGDGTSSTAQNPNHTYNNPGTYTVSLTVHESDGDSDTETKTEYITVNAPPEEGWDYIFEDPQRGTRLKINTQEKLFQFIAPDKEFPIKKADQMKVSNIAGRTIIILKHNDNNLQIQGIALNRQWDFAIALLFDKNARKMYLLVDPLGMEDLE